MATLLYFPIEGRAWPIRAAFHIGGLPFTDKHCTFADWGGIKGETPYGMLPTLTVEGKPATLCSSNAILRYVGRKAKLYPEDLYEAAVVDGFLDAIEDILAIFHPVVRASEAEKPAAVAEALKCVPGWLTKTENQHKAMGTKFLGSNDLTVVDLKFLALIKFIGMFGGSLDGHPALVALFQAVSSNEKVVAYIKSTEH